MPRIDDYTFRHDGVIYTFAIEAQPATYESKVQGRKVFKDVEILNATVPSAYGVPKQANSDVVTEDLLWRKDAQSGGEGGTLFSDHYAKWKQGITASASGLPVSQFEEFSAAQVKTLEASKIDTVEAFIETDDGLLSKLIGPSFRQLRDKARERIGFSVDPGVKAVRAENVKMKDDLELARIQMESQGSQLEEMRRQIAALSGGNLQTEKSAGRQRAQAAA